MSIWGTGILNGLRISMRNLIRGPITVQYPRQKVKLPERARWAVQMKLDDEGNHKCTGCLACEKACPDYIIRLDITTDEERNKHIDRWHYEIGACMMCGLCVEACPFDAIEQGQNYELARLKPEELECDLLVDTPAAKPKRAERPAAQAASAKAAPEAPQPAEPAPEAPVTPAEEVGSDD
jgi:NADH-quinone oxidoreductase subunit I